MVAGRLHQAPPGIFSPLKGASQHSGAQPKEEVPAYTGPQMEVPAFPAPEPSRLPVMSALGVPLHLPCPKQPFFNLGHGTEWRTQGGEVGSGGAPAFGGATLE